MAWVDIGTKAALVDGSTTRGWAHFEYDNASGTTTRPCRIRIEARSGYSFNIMFRNITVAGVNRGTVTGVTQSSGTIWSGNIAAGGNVTATWENPWYAGTKYPSVSGNLPAGGSAPTGGAITYNSCTWNSVNITSSVSSWGGLTGNFQAIVITGSYNGDAANAVPGSWNIGRKVYNKNNVSSSTLSYTVNATDLNVSTSYNNPIAIKGLLHYKLAYWDYNSAGRIDGLDNTLRYLPPAPSQFSYGTPTGSTDLTFPVTFAGVAANNHTTYDSASLTRTIRYKIGNGNWTYVDNGTVAAIDFATNFDITVPAGQVATIEGWQTYHGMDSAVETITIANTNAPVALYGSVGGETKKLGPVYASVNGRTKKLKKIYASVGGVTKKVYEDV